LAFCLLFLLVGCGNLEWPPKNSGPGFTINSNRLLHPGESIGQPILDTQNTYPSPSPTWKEHTVTAGETLSGIAQAYNTDIYELAILNQIEPPFRIYIGQSLRLPGFPGKPVQLAAFKRSLPIERENLTPLMEAQKRSTKGEPKRSLNTRNESVFLKVKPGIKPLQEGNFVSLSSTTRKFRQTIITETGSPLPPMRKGSSFIWPVEGNLISKFGAKGEGLRNDGVNIVAPRGTAVLAARPGVVAYAGNELRGFGNLLLIKHGNGWVTAYAHNDSLLVRRGEKVRRGQVIAHVGNSGNVVQPQLHFEIRKGNRAVDPMGQISYPKRRRTVQRRRISKS